MATTLVNLLLIFSCNFHYEFCIKICFKNYVPLSRVFWSLHKLGNGNVSSELGINLIYFCGGFTYEEICISLSCQNGLIENVNVLRDPAVFSTHIEYEKPMAKEAAECVSEVRLGPLAAYLLRYLLVKCQSRLLPERKLYHYIVMNNE